MKSGKKVKYYLLLHVILTLLSFPTCGFSTTYMEKGELKELPFPKGSRYVLTDKRVLSAKVLQDKQKIIIKSKSSGRSTLKIFSPNFPAKKFDFIVSNPENTLSMTNVMAKLRAINVQFKSIGKNTILIPNPILTKGDYIELVRIYKKKNHSIEIKASLNKALKKEILEDLYLEFLLNDIDSISCQVNALLFICTVDIHENGIDNISPLISQKYLLEIKKLSPRVSSKYSIHLRIVQFENNQQQNNDGGINNFEISIQDAINKNIKSLIENKKIFLQELGGTLSLVAQPKISFTPGEKAKIQIGSEVQQQTINQNGIQGQEWKFFGIELILDIKKYGSYYKTHYKLRFSTPPTLGRSNSNSGESATSLYSSQESKLFDFEIQVESQTKSQSPLIGDIPFIGGIFKNKTNQAINKKIMAFATIKEEKRAIQ